LNKIEMSGIFISQRYSHCYAQQEFETKRGTEEA